MSSTAVALTAARPTSTTAAIRARDARPGAINRLQLDDLDIGNRRLIVDGRIRTLDKHTLQAAPAWLKHRRRRRPTTANPHLLINKQTALETGPISGASVSAALRGQTATHRREDAYPPSGVGTRAFGRGRRAASQ
ncbi:MULTISPECIES: hypothetical protein [Streptomyces]|uniref:hypothetical protein n=1 Tax=Streptomyces TaxID=1883 RepID=UPI00116572F9|nr:MULTISPECIES: hypothetical protein [unclassified Streptomyces]QDN54568.1 hypothetical protein FNV67_03465 [Streptomyces sp. S1D4-20]QDN64750.1 hypothetical protein FNV66_03090 [Streptomyces sp. S1D4-14]QDN75062.1 hypothetical protein FNV64_04975 [Streptomyces sp. S1A1-7]QDO47157.1 hypothetical protein FNV60_01330 [Streptomyces sp. RLB3-5]QDO57398.1 hypothetical protein FNV59_03565 [Streptomyces sp. RLB1-8]